MKTIIAKISSLIARLNATKNPAFQMEHGTAKLSPRQVWDANKTKIRKTPADAVPDFLQKETIERYMSEIRKGSV